LDGSDFSYLPGQATPLSRDVVWWQSVSCFGAKSVVVEDFTYTSIWTGFVYVAVVIDAASRRILRSRAARSMTTVLVLDSVEKAMLCARKKTVAAARTVAHSAAGSEFTWEAFTTRLLAEGLSIATRPTGGGELGRFVCRPGLRGLTAAVAVGEIERLAGCLIG